MFQYTLTQVGGAAVIFIALSVDCVVVFQCTLTQVGGAAVIFIALSVDCVVVFQCTLTQVGGAAVIFIALSVDCVVVFQCTLTQVGGAAVIFIALSVDCVVVFQCTLTQVGGAAVIFIALSVDCVVVFQCTLTQVGGAVNFPLSVERIVHTKKGWDSCYVPLFVDGTTELFAVTVLEQLERLMSRALAYTVLPQQIHVVTTTSLCTTLFSSTDSLWVKSKQSLLPFLAASG